MTRTCEVPTDLIRSVFEQSGVSASELARRLGWLRPDSARVSRQLGITFDRNGHGSPIRNRGTMSYERAIEICEALGIDPVDVDL